jgi:signal transduction histidine kinase
MDSESETSKYSPVIAIIFFSWLAYASLDYIFKMQHTAETFFGSSTYLILLVLQTITLVYSVSLWRTPSNKLNKIFAFFSIAFALVIVDSSIYHITNNILHLRSIPTFWSSTDNIVYLGYLVFQLAAWSAIIGIVAKNYKNYKVFTFLPIAAILSVLLIAFIIDIAISNPQFSVANFYSMSDKGLELINLAASITCLVLAKDKGLFYLALGFSIDTAFSTAMDFGVLGQSYGVNSIIETIWILSWLIRIYGFLNLKKIILPNTSIENLTYEPNSLRVQFTFWIFILAASALFLVLTIRYFASPTTFFLTGKKVFPLGLLVFTFFTIVGSNILIKIIYNPLKRFEELANIFLSGQEFTTNLTTKSYNISEFQRVEAVLHKAFTLLQTKKIAENELHQLALQTAHDIRSPAAALQIISSEITGIPEKTRDLISEAASRINQIADDLIQSYKTTGIIDQLNSELIISLVNDIIHEKTLKFKNKPLKLILNPKRDISCICCNVNPLSFKRAISNLIDNAAEMIGKEKGAISVNLSKDDDWLRIEIIDTGCGIDDEMLNLLNAPEISYNGKDVFMLGILAAINYIKTWNGKYRIKSAIGTGTTFTIKLPIAEPPAWLLDKLVLTPNTMIVVLDNEEIVYEIWANKLFEYLRNDSIKLAHFSGTQKFANYLKRKSTEKQLFLVDYDIKGSSYNGVEVIQKYQKLKGNAILVTGFAEREELRKQCTELGIKIIPKNYIPFIPVEIG